MSWDRVAFAAQRRKAQDDLIAALEPVIGRGLADREKGSQTWWRQIVDAARPLYDQLVRDSGGSPARAHTGWAWLSLNMTHSLVKTQRITDYTHTVIAVWLANAILNAAAVAAADQTGRSYELEWVSMHDTKVRHTHQEADGQRVKPGHHFRVGLASMRWPGDPTAPVKEWINCRCHARVVPQNQASASNTEPRPDQGAGMTMTSAELAAALTAAVDAGAELLPWHGVLAPEGEWSGDRRMFGVGGLDHRDMPLPLTWQKTQEDAHNGSVTVGSIDWMERRGNLMHGGGSLLATPEADEFTGLMAHFGRFGVSVDADAVERTYAREDGTEANFEADEETDVYGELFTYARICSASAVNIPAFPQAYVMIGTDPEHDYGTPMMAPPEAAAVNGFPGTTVWTATNSATLTWPNTGSGVFVSEKPWNGSASRFTPEQYKASCVLHRCDGMEKSCHSLPIKEPDGQLSRAGVHSAAGRLNQVTATAAQKASAARALRSAYKTLGEDPPEGLVSEVDVFTVETLEDVPTDSVCLHEGCQSPPTVAVSTDDPMWFGLFCDAHAAEHEDQPLALESGEATTFGRGPGWLTNPVDTKRIHDFWTVPGEEGYAKIGWGTPGDFDRCKVEVGQEIAENSPDKLVYLNQTCAQWHHDALGRWPAEDKLVEALDGAETAPAVCLVASAGAVAPAEWFCDPELAGKTPIQITDDGRIYGHLAYWDTCHMSFNTPGVCITPPRTATGYGCYLTGEVMTSDGPVATGPLTLGTGHARTTLSMRPALAHYDNTGTAVADVTCGEDAFGVWVAGWVRPWVSEEKVYELRAASLSGDWRRDPNTGNKELIAALAVNSPGFPAPRVGIRDGIQVALVASAPTAEPDTDSEFVSDLADAVAHAIEDRARRRSTVAGLDDLTPALAGLELEEV